MTWYNSRYNELITNSHRINFKVPLHFISSIFQALQAMCFKHWISSQVSCKLLECKVFCCGLPSAPVAEMPVFWEDWTLVGSSINLCMKPPLVTIVSNRNRNFVTLKGLSYVVKKGFPFSHKPEITTVAGLVMLLSTKDSAFNGSRHDVAVFIWSWIEEKSRIAQVDWIGWHSGSPLQSIYLDWWKKWGVETLWALMKLCVFLNLYEFLFIIVIKFFFCWGN